MLHHRWLMYKYRLNIMKTRTALEISMHWMCVYIFMYVCICLYVHMYVCICLYAYMYACMYIYIYACMYIYIFMHACMCVCVFIYFFIFCSFLQHLNKSYDASVPLVLMNSFNTDDDTQKVIRKYQGFQASFDVLSLVVYIHWFYSFSYIALLLYNKLPITVTQINSLNTFKSHLKAFLFSCAYDQLGLTVQEDYAF